MVLYKTIGKKRLNRMAAASKWNKYISRPRYAGNLYPMSTSKEIKAVDFTNAGNPPGVTIISTTPSFTLLNALFLGTDVNNRIGRKIALVNMQFTAQLQIDNARLSTDDYLRVMVVYDRQPPLATLAPLLSSYDGAGNVSSTPFDYLNISNSNRFKVLADIRYCFDGPGTTAHLAQQNTDYKGEYNVHRFIKLHNLQAHYDQAVSTSTPVEGALYCVTVGRQTAATSAYSLAFTARTRFMDI